MDKKLARGLTLLELIISVAITTIMIGITVPVTGNIISTNRISGQVNELRGGLALTRSEAIRRNQHVVICKSIDGNACSKRGRWDMGWIVYADENRNRKRDDDEEIILIRNRNNTGYRIDYRAFGSKNYVAYRPTGFTKTNGTFIVCNAQNANYARALILTKTGRVRLSKTRAAGEPIVCPK